MPDYEHVKGRVVESVQFISEEMREFENDNAAKSWQDYRDDKKLQKLIDRTVENILTALIEVCGAILVEEGIAVGSYGEALKKCSKLFNVSAGEQEQLSRLALQRNRLAHRYLNYRWQAVEVFNKKDLLVNLINAILQREEERAKQPTK
jgi:uncharacterized protein YutE (UPF0331/DUF86 family)